MEKFLSLKELIKLAKKENIDLGKGDPYNRLRYYTKIEWIPHMIRKTNEKGEMEGHYPAWTLDILKKIQTFKNEGYTNEQIEEKIKTHNNIQKTINIFGDKKNLNKIYLYALSFIVALILLNELNIINIGKSKKDLITTNTSDSTRYIYNSGTGILPRGSTKVFVKTGNINEMSKVNITFRDDYTPINRYWIKEIEKEKGFYLETDLPATFDITFNWFISN